MVGSPRGASCLPSTAEGFEGWREWWCGGGGCGGVPEVRTRTVALATACKIASSALLVTMGFFSFCCSLSLAQHGEAHLAPQRLVLIRTQSNGPFPLCSVLHYPFFSPSLSFSVFSS